MPFVNGVFVPEDAGVATGLAMIRLGTNADGPRIGELVAEGGFDVVGLDWTRIEPYWLVADNGEEIVGCLQVLPGRPAGRLELLAAEDSLTHREKAMVIKALITQGLTTLKLAGAQLATGMVPFEHKAYKRLLKKRGAVVIASGNMLAKVIN